MIRSLGLTAILLSLWISILISRGNWFFFDEWNLYLDRQLQLSDLVLPHNGHWSTFPFVIDLLLFKIFAFSTYVPYLLVVSFTNVLLCVVMFKTLTVNNFGKRTSFVSSLLLLAPAVGFENLFWAFQLGYLSSMLFGTLAFFYASKSTTLTNRDAFLVGIFVLGSCASSGIGIAFGFSMSVFLILKRQNKLVLIGAIGFPVVIYALWFSIFGASAIQGPISPISEIMKFTWFGMIAAMQNGLLLTSVNSSVVASFIILLFFLALVSSDSLSVHFALAYLLGGIAFYLLTAISRASFGVEYAASYRYMHIFFIFSIPFVALVLETVFKKGTIVSFATTLGMLLLVYQSGKIFALRGESQVVQERASQVSLASSHLLLQGFPNSVISSKPMDQFAPQVEFNDLNFIAQNRGFDDLELNSDDIAQSALRNSIVVRSATPSGKLDEKRCLEIAAGLNQIVTSEDDLYIEVTSFETLEVSPNIPGAESKHALEFNSAEIPEGNSVQFAASDFSWTINNTGQSPIQACTRS
jgi:hypothetical protein